jgi:ubiquinone/menaquinone biosynthesis C-methylase UbiE
MHERRFKADMKLLRSSSRMELLEVDRVVKLCLERFDAQNVLDVGTGTGLFAETFASKGLEVTGIDANPEMVEAAQLYVPQSHFQQAAAEKIPFPDKMFDLVFLGLVLHETDDPLLALKEARRLAELGVAVLEWSYQEEEHGPPLAHRLKPEDIEALAQRAGFQGVDLVPLKHLMLYSITV